MNRAPGRGRACVLPVLLGAVLAALAALTGACADDGAGAALELAGTWSGTRSEGEPTVALGSAVPFDHAAEGDLTLTFTAQPDGSFTGTIDIDPDICWWQGASKGPALLNAPLQNIVIDVGAERITFDYDSPNSVGLMHFAAPYPPGLIWTGSYDGSECPHTGASTWVGDFTVRP